MSKQNKSDANPQDAIALIHLRNEFYRDNFRRIIWLLLVSIILNVVLAAGFLFESKRQPGNFYFATTATGQLIPLYPTTLPVVSDSTVLNWVSNNVPRIYQLDFINYRSELNQLQGFFTPNGWQQFVSAYSTQLTNLVSQKLVMSATPSDVPVITGRGVLNGAYEWQVQMPLVLNLQQGDTQTTQKVLVTLVVARVNNTAADQLLGIVQIVQQLVNN